MASIIQSLLEWLRSLFFKVCINSRFIHRLNLLLTIYTNVRFKTEMELTLVGLQNSGKTTLVNVIAVCIFK